LNHNYYPKSLVVYLGFRQSNVDILEACGHVNRGLFVGLCF